MNSAGRGRGGSRERRLLNAWLVMPWLVGCLGCPYWLHGNNLWQRAVWRVSTICLALSKFEHLRAASPGSSSSSGYGSFLSPCLPASLRGLNFPYKKEKGFRFVWNMLRVLSALFSLAHPPSRSPPPSWQSSFLLDFVCLCALKASAHGPRPAGSCSRCWSRSCSCCLS